VTSLLKLLEKAPLEFSKTANVVVDAIVGSLDVDEMKANRGKDYDTTKFYQIRVKPRDKAQTLQDTLNKITKFLKSGAGKSLGVTEVEVNERSRNSG
jgi:hypothetical protein